MSSPLKPLLSPFQSFVRSESASGIVLMVMAVFAFAWANSPWAAAYFRMLEIPLVLGFGRWRLEHDLLHWVNDGLMAVFFLYVGLEIKREVLVGELSDRRAAALPIFAAVGGMVVPAAVFALINRGSEAIHGWGIPMATDIAFALGIMSLLGNRVPLALKVFLTALAIVDDLGAILVIAIFYSRDLHLAALVMSLLLWGLALLYSRTGGRRLTIYCGLGILMWYFMFISGVHATVSGVLLALTIPLHRLLEPDELKEKLAVLFQRKMFEVQQVELEHVEELVDQAQSPLHDLEHGLQRWVGLGIMPIFALFNAGFALSPGATLFAPLPLGAFLGLLLGKPVGILLFSWLAVAVGIAALPREVNWRAMLGTGLLGGIGFTMSLFIAALAFSGDQLDEAKLGVLAASVVAAITGVLVLTWSLPKQAALPQGEAASNF